MQTSSRMWLESVRNWITDILGSGSTPKPNYVDVGVQTGTRSSWELFKESFTNFFNLESSSSTISTPTNVRVNTWFEELSSTQSVDLHDSESPLSIYRFGSDSSSIVPGDSASQITETVFNLQEISPIYNIAEAIVNSQTNFDISSRAEYFNTVSPQLDVELETVMVNGTQYMFAVINDALLTLDPSIFNLFI